MNVVCIGAGRLAHHLMPELQKAGCNILQVYNRSIEHAEQLANKLGKVPFTNKVGEIDETAELIILAVSDNAIAEMANELIRLHDIRGTVVHCSGVKGLDLLPFVNRGVFYPLQSFSEDHEIDWKKTPVIITAADEKAKSNLMTLGKKISDHVYPMSDESKAYLHIAAVFANNFTNHMLAQAQRICADSNIPFEILEPLIRTTIEKALAQGASVSQTGPAMRGDTSTIDIHLELLEKYPELISVYTELTRSIQHDLNW